MQKHMPIFLILVCAFALVLAIANAMVMPVRAQGNDPTELPTMPIIATPATPIITPTLSISATTPVSPSVPISPTRVTSPTVAPTRAPTTPPPPSPITTTPAPPSPTTAPPTQTPVPATAVPPSPPPTVPPAPTATPFPMDIVVKFVTENPWIAIVFCGVILVVALGLLILFALRGRGPQPPLPFTAPSAFITSVENPTVQFDLTRDVMTIGRAKGCDIQIAEKHQLAGADSISRQHARFEKRGERWLLIDSVEDGKPATNGIFVHGARTRVNYLEDGVEIRFGEVAFIFHAPIPVTNFESGGAR